MRRTSKRPIAAENPGSVISQHLPTTSNLRSLVPLFELLVPLFELLVPLFELLVPLFELLGPVVLVRDAVTDRRKISAGD
jgi:hypothetical protein